MSRLDAVPVRYLVGRAEHALPTKRKGESESYYQMRLADALRLIPADVRPVVEVMRSPTASELEDFKLADRTYGAGAQNSGAGGNGNTEYPTYRRGAFVGLTMGNGQYSLQLGHGAFGLGAVWGAGDYHDLFRDCRRTIRNMETLGRVLFTRGAYKWPGPYFNSAWMHLHMADAREYLAAATDRYITEDDAHALITLVMVRDLEAIAAKAQDKLEDSLEDRERRAIIRMAVVTVMGFGAGLILAGPALLATKLALSQIDAEQKRQMATSMQRLVEAFTGNAFAEEIARCARYFDARAAEAARVEAQQAPPPKPQPIVVKSEPAPAPTAPPPRVVEAPAPPARKPDVFELIGAWFQSWWSSLWRTA